MSAVRRLHIKLARVAKALKAWRKQRSSDLRMQSVVAKEVIGHLNIAREARQLTTAERRLRVYLRARIQGIATVNKMRIRQRKNFIVNLCTPQGLAITHDEKQEVLCAHFQGCLTVPRKAILNWEELGYHASDLSDLKAPFLMDVLKKTVFGMPKEKAHGPDGFIGPNQKPPAFCAIKILQAEETLRSTPVAHTFFHLGTFHSSISRPRPQGFSSALLLSQLHTRARDTLVPLLHLCLISFRGCCVEIRDSRRVMYGAQLSKDLNLPLQQQPVAGVRTPPQMSSPGLLRYRSAPSTLLGDVCGDFLPATGGGAGHSPGSPDHNAADAVFTRFLAAPPRPAAAAANHFSSDTAASLASQQQQHQQQLMYQSQQQMAAMESLFRTGGNGGLVRQSSSPAGFLNHLNMDSGYGNMLRAGMGGGYGNGNGDPRLRGQLSFSSRQGSVMSQISEMASEELGGGGSDDEEAGSNGGAARGYGGIPGYPMGASPGGGGGWDEPSPSPSPSLPLSPGAMKRPRDAAAAKNGASRQLKQQYSLPASSKPSPEMAVIEKFLQLQDAVPCKIRAKRGCATHPRSIAERVRRTKISDRIRKLLELVPNMEKQTNTSDMLDLAVDYIKELQMQVKVMNDDRTSCTCSASRVKRFAG
ncbi:hypothetical protein ACQ4PT_039026 [Festuca glaucescens]